MGLLSAAIHVPEFGGYSPRDEARLNAAFARASRLPGPLPTELKLAAHPVEWAPDFLLHSQVLLRILRK